MWAREWAEFARRAARPLSVCLLAATLCACAVLSTLGLGEAPQWFVLGAGAAVIEWITERAIKRASNKDGDR